MVEVDNIPPVVTNCPQSSSWQVPLGMSTRVVTWSEPVVTDNSNLPPTITQTHQSGDLFPVGITNVMYTFTDGSGNSAMCGFTVTGKFMQICFV